MPRLHIKVFFNDYFALQIRLVRGQEPTRDAAHSASVSFMKTLNNNENNERKKKKTKMKKILKRNYDYFMVYNWFISLNCYGKTNWPTFTCMYCLL